MSTHSSHHNSTASWKTILAILVGVGSIGAAALGAGTWWMLQPQNPAATETVTVIIPRGRGVSAIGSDLEAKGLIRSKWAFRFAVWKENLAGKIQAGSFELSASQSPFELAQALTQGTNDLWVTLKEGWRAEEMGEYLQEQLPNFSTTDASYAEECLKHQGFLFPETYLVPRSYDTKQMCQLLRGQYGKVFTLEMRNQIASNTGLSDQEAVTLASIVEREARDPEQMRHVAGILLNRLRINMALQVDATLQYAKGYDREKKTWWAPPLAGDKVLNSPYNTYQNNGLPPGPISNPGLNALKAVANPIASDDLYYLHADDGQMYYAATYEEHQENIRKYLW